MVVPHCIARSTAPRTRWQERTQRPQPDSEQHSRAPPAAYNVSALHRSTCGDNSGSFILRLHPQFNDRPKDGFAASGPWSVWGKGTGAYSSLGGHGEFGLT